MTWTARAAIAACALGQFAFASTVRARGPVLLVNEIPVLRLTAYERWRSPSARIGYAAAMLRRHWGAISARGASLRVRGRPFVLVYPADASPYGVWPATLARQWAHGIRDAMASRALRLSDSSISMAVGGAQEVYVAGKGAQWAQIESSDETVVKARRQGGAIRVMAQGAGKAVITVSLADQVRVLKVEALPLSAILPQHLSASVSGAPAMEETVAGAIAGAIYTKMTLGLGADVRMVEASAKPLAPGEDRVFQAHVRASGEGCAPSEGPVFVTVRNEALPVRREEELWYCNSPEHIRKFGPLFASRLAPNTPIRLLYHHVNDLPEVAFFKVQAVNADSRPARLLIIPGDSKPGRDPIQAGLEAGSQFLRAWSRSSGEIVTVPPHSSLPISLRSLSPGQTTSGLCMLQLLEGGSSSVLVRADVREPFPLDLRWGLAIKSSTPWREVGAKRINEYDRPARAVTEFIYPNPFQNLEAKYEVGGPYTFVRIGQQPNRRKDGRDNLEGNFGVFYAVHARLVNPTEAPEDVELVYEASAGYSGALVLINGDLVQTPILKPKGEYRLAKVHLEPDASKSLFIQTLPLSGGSYPATLTLRPVGSDAKYSSEVAARKP
ncbi:MAG: hypothetical protein HYR64_07720 [Fimbriimonas ginsengisoli]|uniref:Uncharacterized protein n=1 Tax=Fimbriimonas ginsengisoli TaxID=1005039 RepID=A0A931LTC1_FIMGI|nr:hypothetical protein [Fimbriimonas ginsengisoli]